MDRPARTLSESDAYLYSQRPPRSPDAEVMNGSGCVFDHYGRIPEGIYQAEAYNSPLEEAVVENNVQRFRELVKEGNSVTVQLRVGKMTCIEFCGMMGYRDMLKALIDSSVNAKILKEYFSLNDVVDRAYMISHNKDIFFSQEGLAEANRYEAALFTAVEYNRPECVSLMLDYLGTREPGRHNFHTTDNGQKNLTASELAEVRGHVKCSEILRNHLTMTTTEAR